MLHILARKFPGNEVRLTWYVAKRPEVERYEDDPTEDNTPPVNPVLDSPSEALAVATSAPLTSCLDLGLNPTPKNNTLPKNRLVPFTRRKARDIKNRLSALATIALPEECIMLTGTLPGSTSDAMATIADLASAIVEKVRRWVRYHSESKYWLYTWEWQKRGALHIHYVVYEPNPDRRDRLLRDWKEKWTEVLLSFGTEKALCLFDRGDKGSWLEKLSVVQADAIALIKNPARYLSKYLSKSKYGKTGDNELFSPKQWSGCSRLLLALTESLTTTVRTTPMTTGTTMRILEELKHEMESTEGRTVYYTHPGELFGTAIHYVADEKDIPELWASIEVCLGWYADGRLFHPPTETMADDPIVEAHRLRNQEKARDLAGRDNVRTADYWRDKYGYLGLRFDSDGEGGNDKNNTNAIATRNGSAIGDGNHGATGSGEGDSSDTGETQLSLFGMT
jgi:hypothetical protein